MSCRARTPQPFLLVLKSWSLVLQDPQHLKVVSNHFKFAFNHLTPFIMWDSCAETTSCNSTTMRWIFNTWVHFALRGSCRSSNRSMHGCTQRRGEAPPGRIQGEDDRSEDDEKHMSLIAVKTAWYISINIHYIVCGDPAHILLCTLALVFFTVWARPRSSREFLLCLGVHIL